jgi:hypothetical protein
LLALVAAAFGLGLLKVANTFALPLPVCGFRQWTDLPCAGCGSTRAVLALSGGDIAGAWRWNPLATVAVCGAILGLATWLWDRRFGTAMAPAAARCLRPWLSWKALAALLGLNWLYLLLNGAHWPGL